MIVYVDGGCHGNGTAEAKGYGSYKLGEHEVVRVEYPPHEARTNNEAEYQTLVRALEDLGVNGIAGAQIKMDSQLVVNQVNRKWKVSEERMRRLCVSAQRLLAETKATLEWVRREEMVGVVGH